jgi:hypothetical protein
MSVKVQTISNAEGGGSKNQITTPQKQVSTRIQQTHKLARTFKGTRERLKDLRIALSFLSHSRRKQPHSSPLHHFRYRFRQCLRWGVHSRRRGSLRATLAWGLERSPLRRFRGSELLRRWLWSADPQKLLLDPPGQIEVVNW